MCSEEPFHFCAVLGEYWLTIITIRMITQGLDVDHCPDAKTIFTYYHVLYVWGRYYHPPFLLQGKKLKLEMPIVV